MFSIDYDDDYYYDELNNSSYYDNYDYYEPSGDFDSLFGVIFSFLLPFILLFLVIALVITILYLMNLQNTLNQVHPSRRKVSPGNVWLMLIPLFNVVYSFFLYPKISESVKAEYEYRGLQSEGDFGRGIGIAIPITNLASIIPFVGWISVITNFVLFIIFWVKTSQYKTTLMSTSKERNT